MGQEASQANSPHARTSWTAEAVDARRAATHKLSQAIQHRRKQLETIPMPRCAPLLTREEAMAKATEAAEAAKAAVLVQSAMRAKMSRAQVDSRRRMVAAMKASRLAQGIDRQTKESVQRMLGRRRSAKVQTVEAMEIAEKLHDKVHGLRWRGPVEYRLRSFVAWFMGVLLYVIFCLAAAVYGVVKFKGAATNYMLASWGVAAIQTYIIIEPVQVIVVIALPCLVNEQTRCGRCCLRCRFWYNEIFAP